MYRSTVISVCVTLLKSSFFQINRGSRARISGCNIVRNGFGSKRQPTVGDDDDQADQQRPVVPSGHSGVFVCVSNRLYYRMSHLTSTLTTTTD